MKTKAIHSLAIFSLLISGCSSKSDLPEKNKAPLISEVYIEGSINSGPRTEIFEYDELGRNALYTYSEFGFQYEQEYKDRTGQPLGEYYTYELDITPRRANKFLVRKQSQRFEGSLHYDTKGRLSLIKCMEYDISSGGPRKERYREIIYSWNETDEMTSQRTNWFNPENDLFSRFDEQQYIGKKETNSVGTKNFGLDFFGKTNLNCDDIIGGALAYRMPMFNGTAVPENIVIISTSNPDPGDKYVYRYLTDGKGRIRQITQDRTSQTYTYRYTD